MFAGCANSSGLTPPQAAPTAQEATTGAATATPAATNPGSIANSSIEIERIQLANPRQNFGDAYVRVWVTIPTVDKGVTTTSESESAWARARDNLVKYLWDKKSTLAIIAKTSSPDGKAAIPSQKILQATSDNGAPTTSELQPLVLTPYSTSVDQNLSVRIDVTRSDTVNSQVFKTAMEGLQAASTLVSGGLLSKLSGKDYSEQAQKVDNFVAALEASGSTQQFPFSLNPYTTDRLDVSVKNGNQSVPLFSIAFHINKTLIGSGQLSNIPADPADITKYELPFGTSARTIRNAIAATVAGLTPDTLEAIGTFCRKAPDDLAELGLNRYDRAAVIYAYLRNSLWNRSPKARPDASSDPCVTATSALSEIPQLTLQSQDQIMRDEQALRDKMSEVYRQKLWDKKLPVALQTKNAEDWMAVLSSTVHISVTGAPIKLSDEEALEVGTGTDMSQSDAIPVLLAANLTYKKGIKPCFNFDNETTGLTFTTGCVRVSTDPAKSLKVEFKVDPGFNPILNSNAVPTIREIRFISS